MSSSLSPDQLEGGSRASTEGTDKGVLSSLNLGFFKSLSDKKVTRSKSSPTAKFLYARRRLRIPPGDCLINIFFSPFNSREPAQATRSKAGQQARLDEKTGAQSTGPAVSICL